MKKFILFMFAVAALQACGSCSKPCDDSIPALQPGSCADPDIPVGEAGGKCDQTLWLKGCNSPDLACVRDACIPCGGHGQVCCANFSSCNNGTCENRDDDFPTCNATCGLVGQECCADNLCGAGGQCDLNTGKCVQANQASCGMGTNKYVYGIKDAYGCGNTFSTFANTQADADFCTSSYATANGYTVAPAGSVLHGYDYCNSGSGFDPPAQGTVYAFTDQDAWTCAHSLCTNCTSTVLDTCGP